MVDINANFQCDKFSMARLLLQRFSTIMIRRKEVLGLAVVLIVYLLMITSLRQLEHNNNNNSNIPAINRQNVEYNSSLSMNHTLERNHTLGDIQRMARFRIDTEFNASNYTSPVATTFFRSEGPPLRTVVISTWRSGSTFLGELLDVVPGNYYHYEPLLHYGIKQVRGPSISTEVLTIVKDLLRCNYTTSRDLLNYGITHKEVFVHNTRLWWLCRQHLGDCWNVTVLNAVCRLHPFQSMKLVRLRLRVAKELLQDQSLNVKIVLLVRDPRGMLQSRKHRDWCPGQPDCDNPEIVCADLISDYSSALQIKSKFPDRLKVLRYEDLSLNLAEEVPELYRFLGLDFHSTVKEYLETHTKVNKGGVSSTFRNSQLAPFHWRTDLSPPEIQLIENNCVEAMKLWGYNKLGSQNMSLNDFNLITNYTIS